MKTIINAQLSSEGIQQAIKELDKWNTKFQERVKTFTQRLADEGYSITRVNLDSVPAEYDPGSVTVTVDSTAEGYLTYKASYYMEGHAAIFIEFGAGVFYNTGLGASVHPKGVELGFEIGSWSFGPKGKGLAGNAGWFYGGRYTHGTPTYMPMYSGAQELAQKIQSIANEVFNG